MHKYEVVSVIIPTYNRSALICRTIENVLAQTYAHIEIIVVDDGSTDDTISHLLSFGDRIRVVSQTNAGPAAARNRGIEVSTGDIIAFQDSDDLWAPTKIERQVELLRRAGHSSPCCITNGILKFSNGEQITSFESAGLYPSFKDGLWLNATEVIATRFVLFNQTIAIRRSVLKKIGGYNEALKFADDVDLPLRLSLEGPWVFTSEALATWHQGSSESLSQKANGESICSQLECHVKALEDLMGRLSEPSSSVKATARMRLRLAEISLRLSAARIKRKRFIGSSAVGGILESAVHYPMKLYRRSPWLPRMEVQTMQTNHASQA